MWHGCLVGQTSGRLAQCDVHFAVTFDHATTVATLAVSFVGLVVLTLTLVAIGYQALYTRRSVERSEEMSREAAKGRRDGRAPVLDVLFAAVGDTLYQPPAYAHVRVGQPESPQMQYVLPRDRALRREVLVFGRVTNAGPTAVRLTTGEPLVIWGAVPPLLDFDRVSADAELLLQGLQAAAPVSGPPGLEDRTMTLGPGDGVLVRLRVDLTVEEMTREEPGFERRGVLLVDDLLDDGVIDRVVFEAGGICARPVEDDAARWLPLEPEVLARVQPTQRDYYLSKAANQLLPVPVTAEQRQAARRQRRRRRLGFLRRRSFWRHVFLLLILLISVLAVITSVFAQHH